MPTAFRNYRASRRSETRRPLSMPYSNAGPSGWRRETSIIKEHMDDQDRRIDNQPNGAQEQPNGAHTDGQPNGADETQVGQVLQGLAKVTRQLPAVPASTTRRADARAVQQA